MSEKNNKIIVILGTTASGKTTLGVDLAYQLNGEVISADSRQVYKGMDIGTGKDLCEYKIKDKKTGKVKDIPYHLIDVVSPKTRFDLAKYQKLTYKSIDDILERGKLPLIVGGTGQYIQAVVEDFKLSKNKPNKELRDELEKLDVNKIFEQLKKINLKFAERLNNSDKNNKRRLIRYIEVLKNEEGDFEFKKSKKHPKYEFLIIGLTWPKEILSERIYKRLIERLEKEDMVGEVERLHKEDKVTWKRLEEFGLEYKFISKYLKKEITYDEMVEKLNIAIRQFTKKQKSWFKRWEKQGAEINWVKDQSEANKLIKEFLK